MVANKKDKRRKQFLTKKYCQTCGHLDEVHGVDCKGFKFAQNGKEFGYCHCNVFQTTKEDLGDSS